MPFLSCTLCLNTACRRACSEMTRRPVSTSPSLCRGMRGLSECSPELEVSGLRLCAVGHSLSAGTAHATLPPCAEPPRWSTWWRAAQVRMRSRSASRSTERTWRHTKEEAVVLWLGLESVRA